jgi:hypothetical protein
MTEQKKYNQNGEINFGVYFIDEENGFGYEVVRKQILKRGFGFGSIEDAREAGLQESKKIIHELED